MHNGVLLKNHIALLLIPHDPFRFIPLLSPSLEVVHAVMASLFRQATS